MRGGEYSALNCVVILPFTGRTLWYKNSDAGFGGVMCFMFIALGFYIKAFVCRQKIGVRDDSCALYISFVAERYRCECCVAKRLVVILFHFLLSIYPSI